MTDLTTQKLQSLNERCKEVESDLNDLFRQDLGRLSDEAVAAWSQQSHTLLRQRMTLAQSILILADTEDDPADGAEE